MVSRIAHVEEIEPLPPTTQSHAQSSRDLAAHAGGMIERGDLLQSSEKVWGMVSHAMKEIAHARNWPLDSHVDFGVVADYLRKQTGNDQLRLLFYAVESIHRNFYEPRYSLDQVQACHEDAQRLLPLLEEAHATLPLDLPAPPDAAYRDRQRIVFGAMAAGLPLDDARAVKYRVQQRRHEAREGARRAGRPFPKARPMTIGVNGVWVKVGANGQVEQAQPPHRAEQRRTF